MKKVLFLVILGGILASCGSAKKKVQPEHSQRTSSAQKTVPAQTNEKSTPTKTEKTQPKPTAKIKEKNKSKIAAIIDYAKAFLGTKYRYGGQSKRGMDCSGLVYITFLNAGDIFLPRTSREIAKKGDRIPKNKIKKGDLVFFKTSRRNVINHVGLVVNNKKGNIRFIHSSSSKGVIISSLSQAYWKKSFSHAQRIL